MGRLRRGRGRRRPNAPAHLRESRLAEAAKDDRTPHLYLERDMPACVAFREREPSFSSPEGRGLAARAGSLRALKGIVVRIDQRSARESDLGAVYSHLLSAVSCRFPEG
jgi:hypothetical protein